MNCSTQFKVLFYKHLNAWECMVPGASDISVLTIKNGNVFITEVGNFCKTYTDNEYMRDNLGFKALSHIYGNIYTHTWLNGIKCDLSKINSDNEVFGIDNVFAKFVQIVQGALYMSNKDNNIYSIVYNGVDNECELIVYDSTSDLEIELSTLEQSVNTPYLDFDKSEWDSEAIELFDKLSEFLEKA